MSERVEALKTIGSERKSMKITKAGYKRCKKALKDLGFTASEQIDGLLWLEFKNQIIEDPEYNYWDATNEH